MRGYGIGYGEENNLYELKPEKSLNGYYFIDDKYIPSPGRSSSVIIKEDRTSTTGKYVHQMVVFTFDDCKGREYSSIGIRSDIDHLDMKHENNSVENLQIVSTGINLWRAYSKTKSKNSKDNNCETRFKDYYKSLDEVDKMILKIEIELDMQGKY